MISLSSRQYAMLKKLPDKFDVELARRYNQTTLGSFARRGYVRKVHGKFLVTADGAFALESFGREEIFRRVVTERLSVHFREVLQMRKKTA